VEDAGWYEWEISPWDVPPILMPPSVADVLHDANNSKRSGSRRNRKLYRYAGCIREGERNQTLTSLAGRLRQTPLSTDGIQAALHAENRRRCRPQLDEREIDRIANSAAKWDSPPAWLVDPLTFANDDEPSPSDRHVLIALCHHANHEGRAHPGINRLARMTGYSRPTVIAGDQEVGAVRPASAWSASTTRSTTTSYSTGSPAARDRLDRGPLGVPLLRHPDARPPLQRAELLAIAPHRGQPNPAGERASRPGGRSHPSLAARE